MPVSVELLTGSTKAQKEKKFLKNSRKASLNILIGTHAVIEEVVQFKNLGIVIVDEQHNLVWRKEQSFGKKQKFHRMYW